MPRPETGQFGTGRPGAGAYGTEGGYGRPAAPRNGLGTAALVLGILGVLTSFFLLGVLPGLIAIGLGFLALGRVRRGEATNRGASIAGIVLGFLSLVVAAVLLASGLSFLSSHKSDLQQFQDCVRKATTGPQRQVCSQEFNNRVTSVR